MKNAIPPLLLIFFACAGLVACNVDDELSALQTFEDEERVWVFAQFNVPEESDGIESYYYYAEISSRLYKYIAHNKINEGFILLQNVRYWGSGDVIYEYRDSENSGELVFRIEDLVKLDRVNKAPLIGKGMEQFDDETAQSEELQTEADEQSSHEGARSPSE